MYPAPTTPPPPVAYGNDEPVPAPSPERLLFARAVITLTAVVTLVAFAAMFYRSVTVSEPTSAIVIEGDASFDGALILVTSTEYPAARAKLSAENRYRTPVLLRPGIYSVLVTHQDRVLVRSAFRVEAHRGLVFPLEALKSPQTQPAPAAAADSADAAAR